MLQTLRPTRQLQWRKISALSVTCGKYFSLRADKIPKKEYDAVVVGAGHNGLITAAYLQKAGLKVGVFERRHVIGGAAVTEEIIPGFKFSRASYILSLLRPHIITDLELKKHGLKIYLRNPSSYTPLLEKYQKPGGPKSLTLSPDENFNQRQIAQFSHKDAQIYDTYEDLMLKIVKAVNLLLDKAPPDIQSFAKGGLWHKLKALPTLVPLLKAGGIMGQDLLAFYELMTAPARKFLDKWFESEPLKATLATDSVIGAMASPDTPGSGYLLLHHEMGELEGVPSAWGYPEGGMGAVSNAIASAAVSYGADIFTSKPVCSITRDSLGKTSGVVLEGGQEVKAKSVLSNATPKVTFLDLLPTGSLPENFEAAVKNIDYTSSVTKINAAVNRIPNFTANPNIDPKNLMPHHCCTIHLNCEKMSLLDEAYQEAKQGYISTRPLIEMVMPSSLDPVLAPPGCHVCFFFTQYTPYHLHGGKTWDETTKEEYAQKVFNTVEEYAPGFKDSIVGKEVLPPPELERIFGLTGGNIFHGSMSLDQLYVCRPVGGTPVAPFTPVPGLYLCGSGAHPGGGVMGSPGYLAAKTLLKTLGRK